MEIRKNNLCISEILSRSFNLCKNSFIEIIKAVGVFILPMAIMQMISMQRLFSDIKFIMANLTISSDPYYLDQTINNMNSGASSIESILYFPILILSLFGYLVITKILDYANKGEEVNWIVAIKYIWKKKWRLLGLNILTFIMLFTLIIAFVILSVLITLITFGIGLILIIPLYFALIIVAMPLIYVFNSTMLVRDLGIIDSIRETFLLFKKGYFWSTIGKLSAISGIMIGVSIILMLIYFIPIIGLFLGALSSYIMWPYIAAYFNIFVLDRAKSNIDSFGENNIDNKSGDNFIDPII